MAMKPSEKLEALDANVTTLMVVILLGLNKFIEQTILLISRFTAFTVLGEDVTLWMLYGVLVTVVITYWLLAGTNA